MLSMLFAPKRYLQYTDGVSLLQNGRNGTQWVMARALCYFRCFDLSAVPARERDQALQLQIAQWSPVLDYGNYCAWKGDKVQVWLWDKTMQQVAQQAQGLKSAHCLPETLLHPIGSEGLRYVQLEQGLEAQIWAEGVLLASHWWAKPPTLFQWQRFLRTHRLALREIAEAQPVPWLSKAWARHKASLQSSRFLQEGLLLGVIGSILVGFFAWSAVSLSKWQQAVADLNTQQSALSAQVEPILAQRRDALNQLQTVQTLLNLDAYPSTLALLNEVAKNLPQQSRLIGFTYQPGKLSFTVHARKIDPRFYVNTFEKSPYFREVTTENGANPLQLVLKMQVLKKS